MINWLIKKVIGSKNARRVKSMRIVVDQINQHEAEYQRLSDDELRAKAAAWKAEVSAIDDLEVQQRRLDELLPEAFAAVKNAARRMTERQHTFNVCDQPVTWNMVHFDVQLIGGMCLHRGMIAEMATGEGKTLVATLPLFLNALAGRGAHLVTTNDYLARRDARVDGARSTASSGSTTGMHPARPDARYPARTVRRRHHVRDELGVRVRLPARQRHGHQQGAAGPARPRTSRSSTKWTRS